jgi:hypothetical protein
MLRRVVGASWIRMVLCLPLAAILALLSTRSTLDCLSTLVLGPLSASTGMASTRSSEAGAQDLKPKPTRQQDRRLVTEFQDLQVAIVSEPLPPAWDESSDPAAATFAVRASEIDVVPSTQPAYLRPSDITPLGQLPPPAFPA